jgi:hypothetical protein
VKRSLWQRIVPTPAVLGKKLIHAAPWIVGFTLLGLLLEHAGLLTPLSNFGRDTFGIMRGVRTPVDVRIVDIDDKSLDALFHSQTPLDPRALQRLIDTIERAHPSVIAVDALTSASAFASIERDPSWPAPIVWAEEIVPADAACSTPDDRCAFRISRALGGDAGRGVHAPDEPDACLHDKMCAAVPLYLRLGGVTREYVRRLSSPGVAGRPSFAWAALMACSQQTQPASACTSTYAKARDDDEPHPIDVTAPNPWPYAQNALTVTSLAATPNWTTASELRNHIIIVGGSYHLQDSHRVAGEDVTGAWLNAQVIENELHHPGTEVPWIAGPLLDLAIGAILVYLLYRFRLATALAASAGFIACVLLVTYLLFGRFGIWLDFIPILVGVTLHELQEHVPEYLRLAAAEEQGTE